MNALELYMEQENMHCMEGERGVKQLEAIVKVLGYGNGWMQGRAIEEFLTDNSGAIEAVLGFIHDWSERNSDWKDALQGELFEEEADES